MEKIAKAAYKMAFVRTELQDALHDADPVEAIIIMQMLEATARLLADLNNFASALAQESHAFSAR